MSGEGCDRQNECQDLGWAQQTPLSLRVPEIAAGAGAAPGAPLHSCIASLQALLHPKPTAPPG